MRLLRIGLFTLVMLGASCIIPPAHIDKMDRTPEIFVNMSVPYQVCAGKDDTIPVSIFVTLVWMPAQVVHVNVQDMKKLDLWADPTATLVLERTGLGEHTVTFSTDDGHTATASWSVWRCA